MNNLIELPTETVVKKEEAVKPLYSIERTENGFKITREKYLEAEVTLDGFHLSIRFINKLYDWDSDNAIVPIMNYYELKSNLLQHAVHFWQKFSNEELEIRKVNRYGRVPKRKQAFRESGTLHKWAFKAMDKGLGRTLYPEWKRLISQIDPTAAAVLKKFFVVRGPKAKIPPILTNPKTYQNKNLVQDLLNYNSIYYCLNYTALSEHNSVLFYPHEDNYRTLRSFDSAFNFRGTPVTDWRKLFSDTKDTYKALNKTLDSCPRGFPSGLLFNLKKIHLKEPVFDKIKIMAVCIAIENNPYTQYHRNFQCILRSSPEQIRRAFHLYKNNIIREYKNINQIRNQSRKLLKFQKEELSKCTLRGSKGINRFITHLFDYREAHEGEIVGLYYKVHEWHQDRTYNYAIQNMKKDSPTKLPPIPLPEEKEITFLASINDIANEGRVMGHCIASYASQALRGDCYLFHCVLNKETASIMVDFNGRVVQSYGPLNQVNKASQWAEKVLAQWGKKLAEYKVTNQESFKPVQVGELAF